MNRCSRRSSAAGIFRAFWGALVLIAVTSVVAEPAPTETVLATSGPITANSPQRLVDTRPGHTTTDGRYAGIGRQPAGSTLDVEVAGRAGIPTDATAVVVTVTAVDPLAAGHLTVHPTGTTRPNTSNVNYSPGDTTANTVVTRLGTNGTISIHTHATTHLVVDIAGQFAKDPFSVDLEDLIVGSWSGAVTVPVGWSPITGFWIEFDADGSYSAGTTGSAPAFYYGTDGEHPEQLWEVTGSYPDGQPGSGWITIVWVDNGHVDTTRQGALTEIGFSDAGNRLQFQFWRTWGGRYGPILYDLTRQ